MLQGERVYKKFDMVVCTIPKGNFGMHDRENITAAQTHAAFNIDEALCLCWDVYIVGLLAGDTLLAIWIACC